MQKSNVGFWVGGVWRGFFGVFGTVGRGELGVVLGCPRVKHFDRLEDPKKGAGRHILEMDAFVRMKTPGSGPLF